MNDEKRIRESKKHGARGLADQIRERVGHRGEAVLPKSVDDDVLEALVTTDLRENLPPQLLAVVAGVIKLVEGIGQEETPGVAHGEAHGGARGEARGGAIVPSKGGKG